MRRNKWNKSGDAERNKLNWNVKEDGKEKWKADEDRDKMNKDANIVEYKGTA